MNKSLFITKIFLCFISQMAIAKECLHWFLKAGLSPQTINCEPKCAMTPVDMGTFSCVGSCEKLCSQSLVQQVIKYAPRLTEGDKLMVSKMPYEAYLVFLAKERAEGLTKKIFKKVKKNDESDAFRHFVWSSLLVNKVGSKKAKLFLDAHENDSTQSSQEKEMDLFNNKEGLGFMEDSLKSGLRITLPDIEKEALKRLREKKLKVIQPKFKTIPGGYYSE